jgi:hypothetical protein
MPMSSCVSRPAALTVRKRIPCDFAFLAMPSRAEAMSARRLFLPVEKPEDSRITVFGYSPGSDAAALTTAFNPFSVRLVWAKFLSRSERAVFTTPPWIIAGSAASGPSTAPSSFLNCIFSDAA